MFSCLFTSRSDFQNAIKSVQVSERHQKSSRKNVTSSLKRGRNFWCVADMYRRDGPANSHPLPSLRQQVVHLNINDDECTEEIKSCFCCRPKLDKLAIQTSLGNYFGTCVFRRRRETHRKVNSILGNCNTEEFGHVWLHFVIRGFFVSQTHSASVRLYFYLSVDNFKKSSFWMRKKEKKLFCCQN